MFQDVNVAWPFPDGLLNHEHAKQFSSDCRSRRCFGFSLECSLGICSWQGKARRLWTGKLSYNENYEYLLHLPSPGVSLFCAEVLWDHSPQLHQGDQKPNQTHRRWNRSPPPSQKGMGLESVLCFRRTYGTRSTVCWKSKFLFIVCFFLSWEIVGCDKGGAGVGFEEKWNFKWIMLQNVISYSEHFEIMIIKNECDQACHISINISSYVLDWIFFTSVSLFLSLM